MNKHLLFVKSKIIRYNKKTRQLLQLLLSPLYISSNLHTTNNNLTALMLLMPYIGGLSRASLPLTHCWERRASECGPASAQLSVRPSSVSSFRGIFRSSIAVVILPASRWLESPLCVPCLLLGIFYQREDARKRRLHSVRVCSGFSARWLDSWKVHVKVLLKNAVEIVPLFLFYYYCCCYDLAYCAGERAGFGQTKLVGKPQKWR